MGGCNERDDYCGEIYKNSNGMKTVCYSSTPCTRHGAAVPPAQDTPSADIEARYAQSLKLPIDGGAQAIARIRALLAKYDDAVSHARYERDAALVEALSGAMNLAELPLQVVSGLLIRDGRALFARRAADREFGGYWEVPGGKVEAGESHIEALVREFEEEVGLTLDPNIFVGVGTVYLEPPVVRRTCRVFMYAVKQLLVIEGPQCLDNQTAPGTGSYPVCARPGWS